MDIRGKENMNRLRTRFGNGSTSDAPPAAAAVQSVPFAESGSPAQLREENVLPDAAQSEKELSAPHGDQQEPPADNLSVADALPVAGERAGWFSPRYSKSRQVVLNPRTLRENGCIVANGDGPDVEQYRVLRTRIMQHIDISAGATIMVTSALPGEGKTLTAINLALTLAREFEKTVLLVDCDLNRQDIHKLLGYASERGLADYLLGNAQLEELFVWPGIEKLTVISGGATVKEGSELLGSPSMRTLVHEMKHRYSERIVIFDLPSVLSGAEAIVFAPLVDSILVTVRAGETPVQVVTKAIGMLPHAKIIGTVLNRHQAKFSSSLT